MYLCSKKSNLFNNHVLIISTPAPTILLGFLWLWTWGISSLPLQQSTATVPALCSGCSSTHSHGGTGDQAANIHWIIEKAREF